MTIELTEEEFAVLKWTLGCAKGVADRFGDMALVIRVMRLANTINAGRPDWKPYEIPPAAPGGPYQ